ncbi:hypothetical protein [Pseudomonas rubra]|uniref:Uncharacterized protein n=1 Tax=Pseudomonas rubra TaxID=2942627 RepID=A0ABT5P3T0_9PSED|nr:hypothetical protein [Pseudomonas rubra]MDD1012941.1 hypothetical protein [Pseudomonas rubra]MDD1038191.1 hypothetical protein [Pseudomonas rubra]MDD1156729.1 hypothetical protein [Pseudomonas rubra]
MSNQQAAVIGAGLMSFMPGLTPAQRGSVTLAVLQAERETQFVHEQGQVEDWYSYYKNKLKYYGWDAVPPREVHWPGNERSEIVDSALKAISAVAGSQYAQSTELALQALKRDTGALLHFEQRTRQHGLFQLLPCAPASNGSVDMVLYHEVLEQSQVSAGFLFRKRRQQRFMAELVRFNTRLFDQQFRSKVERSLQAVSVREILELQL